MVRAGSVLCRLLLWIGRVTTSRLSREASRAPKLWYRKQVGPLSMCRHGRDRGLVLYTVPPAGADTWYIATAAVDCHQMDGWVDDGWVDGCMHGWVRLEEPCKAADYDCGDMVGLYCPPPPVATPSGLCLRMSVRLATATARLVNTPRLSPRGFRHRASHRMTF